MLQILRQILPLLVIGGGFTFVGSILFGTFMLGRYRGRDEISPVDIEGIEARLYRLEQATLQLMNAVDRVESSQRTTAQIIADSALSGRRSALPERSVTPH